MSTLPVSPAGCTCGFIRMFRVVHLNLRETTDSRAPGAFLFGRVAGQHGGSRRPSPSWFESVTIIVWTRTAVKHCYNLGGSTSTNQVPANSLRLISFLLIDFFFDAELLTYRSKDPLSSLSSDRLHSGDSNSFR